MTTAKELAKKAEDLKLVIDKYLPGPTGNAGVYPDADHVAAELMWGGIWNEPGLDHTLRSFATITAQAVNGFDFGLRHQCRVGLSLGIPPQTLKALMLELRFWIHDPMNGVSNVKSDVLLQVWDRFRAHGFEFPSPQREVHITAPVEVRVRGADGAGEAKA
jgi:small-conductance mechanosensitive channel